MALLLTVALCCAALLAGCVATLPLWLTSALCFAAGLALTLGLAARLTPAGWWRKPTARGLFIAAGGTWACGSALTLAVGLATPSLSKWHGRDAPRLAMAQQPGVPGATAPQPAPQAEAPAATIANQPFRVHRSLNLRAGPAVGSPRLAIIPAGAHLSPTGQRVGDWWQVHNSGDGQTGWVSSLWLRRPAETGN